jgi:hypothetical protein
MCSNEVKIFWDYSKFWTLYFDDDFGRLGIQFRSGGIATTHHPNAKMTG